MQYDIQRNPALGLFSDLLAEPSPSGREDRVAQIIRAKLAGCGYAAETDGCGNVFVRLAGRERGAPLCCLAAHTDEIGMVVTKVEPDGTLKVQRSGGLLPHKIGEAPVQILGDVETVVGILSMGSGHGANSDRPVGWDDVWVITGLTQAQLAAAGVRPGCTGVPVRAGRGPVVFGDPQDPMVAAWTFDDRMGCVALLRMLETMAQDDITPYHPTIVAFTVHEEGGGHGAKALAHRERTKTFISVDGCPMPKGTHLQLDGRPGIWSRDSYAHYDQRLVRFISKAAREAGTELQPVAYPTGAAADAGMVYATGGAERIGCFGHVRENSHGYEVARLSVFDNLHRTLVRFVSTWEGE